MQLRLIAGGGCALALVFSLIVAVAVASSMPGQGVSASAFAAALMEKERIPLRGAGPASATNMVKVPVRDAVERLAVANDGSPMFFYFRPAPAGSPLASHWVVYLQGGFDCYDLLTCGQRWIMSSEYMSTKNLPNTTTRDGLVSADPRNPLAGANAVFLPYVTSDTYMGNASAEESGTFWSFRGRACLDAVLSDLFAGFATPDGAAYRVAAGSSIVFTGTSAGGIGVLMNAHHVERRLREELCPSCSLQLVIDSGFFVGASGTLRNESECTANILACGFNFNVDLGLRLWNAEPQINPQCAAAMRSANTSVSHCAYGSVAVSFITVRTLYVEYLFDAVELMIDGFANKASTEKINALSALKRHSLAPPRSVFMPSCWGHVISNSDENWDASALAVRNTTFGEALRRWYFNGANVTLMDDCIGLTGCRTCPITPPWLWFRQQHEEK